MNQQFAAASGFIKAGKGDKAVALLLPLLRKAPAHAPLRYLLGVAYGSTGDHQSATFHLGEAHRIDPRNPTILLDLGRSRAAKGDVAGAAQALERVLAITPRHDSAYIELSNLHLANDNLTGAIDALARAVHAHAEATDAWKALSALELTAGRADRSAERLREAMLRHPTRPEIDTYLCATMNYLPGATPQDIFRVHAEFGRKTMAHIRTPIAPFTNDRDPERPLTIGWLSPDFRRHSVAYFLEPLLEHLDKGHFRQVLFSTGQKRDEVTERLASHGTLVPCRDVEFKALPELIRSHRTDVLIELSGHTADHRLWSLARKPAPVIVTYLGYPNTTGLPTIDYRIVDAITDPPKDTSDRVGLPDDWTGADALATEQLVRLDAPFLCYRPPEHAPEVAPAPCSDASRPITFGSFNAIQKVNPELARAWAGVLDAAPGSRLVLKGDYRLSEVRATTLAWFAAAGIDASRIELRPMTLLAKDHLTHYADIDIALDSFPYAGTTTTCEALFMGVPVLSMVGATHASRVGLTILRAVGLGDFACSTAQELADKAKRLAADRARLAGLRSTLRPRLLASPLCDGTAYAARFGAAIRDMWRAYAATGFSRSETTPKPSQQSLNT